MAERRYCTRPFTEMFVAGYGEEPYACCFGKRSVDMEIDYTSEDAGQDLRMCWFGYDNLYYIRYRESIMDGSYSMCDMSNCNIKHKHKTLQELKELAKTNQNISDMVKCIETGDVSHFKSLPLFVEIAVDRSCNLKCKSCRKDYEHMESLDFNWDGVYTIIEGAEEICFGGDGEPFFSHKLNAMKSFNVADYPKLKRICIMTNGTLITKKFYELSDAFRQKIHKMYVSVDACRPETYSKIRGTEKQFEDVIKGIRVLVGNGIGVEVLITIQNDNLSDILDSMSLYKSIGVERIVFTNIRNWGAMTAEEFSTAAVHHPGNPRYSEYKSIIDILKKDSFALLFIET